MVGVICLDYGVARLFGAPRSAYNLCKHCKGSLGGAVVVKIKRGVGKENANKRNVGEIVSFGYHLRAEKHVCLVTSELAKQLIV